MNKFLYSIPIGQITNLYMVYNMRYSEVNNSIIENSCGWKTEKVLWTKNYQRELLNPRT